MELDLDPGLAGPAAALLTRAGVLANVQVVERRREQVFRGSKRVETTSRLAVTFSAPEGQADELIGQLRALVPGSAGAARAPEQAVTAAPTAGRSTLAVVVERSREARIGPLLADLGLEPLSIQSARATVKTSFRGSVTNAERPAVRVSMEVPTALVDHVIKALIDGGLVPADALERFTVEVGAPHEADSRPVDPVPVPEPGPGIVLSRR